MGESARRHRCGHLCSRSRPRLHLPLRSRSSLRAPHPLRPKSSVSARRWPRLFPSRRSTSACARASLRATGSRSNPSPLPGMPACSRRWPPTVSTLRWASGPAMAFIVKGSPVKAVAAMAGPPLLMTIVVRPDGAKTVAELKGRKISVSTAGSLTYWLVSETSRRQGWGPKGIEIAPMGAMPGQIAAMKRGDIDGAIMDVGNAFELEKKGEGRILVSFTDITDFHIHVIFATDKLIAEHPRLVRAFLRGWFETIAVMRRNKAATVAIAAEVTSKDEDVTACVYDVIMPMFSDTGKFNPDALATLAKSYGELQLLPAEPEMAKLYTEEFLPK